jgi:hypothetical protein
MTLRLFDVQTGFGGGKKGETQVVSREECLGSMARLDIAAALVRALPDAMDCDAIVPNELLFAACAGHPELVPCPVALPAAAGEVDPEPDQVDAFIRRGAGAALIRPARDEWLFAFWVCDPLLDAMQARRLPLFCAVGYVNFEQTAQIAERYPRLPIILAEAGYRSQRTIVPLLQTFRNVHLSIGSNWTIHRGIEDLVAKVGSEQLLFGTGFPAAEPMMAITQLMYAEITDERKQAVGAGNFERLLAGVIR